MSFRALPAIILAVLVIPPTDARAGDAARPGIVPWRVHAESGIPGGRGVLRSKRVTVDASALREAGPGRVLLLDGLGPGTRPARVRRVERHADGGVSVQAGLFDGGTAYLHARGPEVVASIEPAGSTVYTLLPSPAGHVLRQVDPVTLPPCGGAPEPPLAPVGELERPDVSSDTGSLVYVDVLAVYTPAAAAHVGGARNAEAIARLSLDKANASYENSGVRIRARLVSVRMTAYAEPSPGFTSFRKLLDAVTAPADQAMDEVHAWRAECGADQVVLLASDDSYCGLAWLMRELSPHFAASAFFVVNIECALAGYTVAHEMGHNQGCHHAHDDGSNQAGLFPYSNGWRFIDGGGVRRRTVMAYEPGAQIPHFSNPDVSFMGVPTGVPAGNPRPADNALSLNNAAATVAGWTASATPPDVRVEGWAVTAEEFVPANRSVDPGETVTVEIRLGNTGSADAADVRAVLLPGSGIEPLGSEASFGDLPPGRPLSAVAFGSARREPAGSLVTVRLALQAGSLPLGDVEFPVVLGGLGAQQAGALSAGEPAVIPDAGALEQAVFADLLGTVTGVTVGVRLDHPHVGDLSLELIGPDGTRVALANRQGGDGNDFGSGADGCTGTFAVFDDAAPISILAASPRTPGRYGRLSRWRFSGDGSPRGAWTLRVTDHSAGDTGRLFCWNLALTTRAPSCARPATMDEARRALALAAGTEGITDGGMALDVVGGGSAGTVDFTDAVTLVRSAAG